MSGADRVVIAGGSGLIGRALAHSLVAQGREVVVLSRSAEPPGLAGCRVERWDGESLGRWREALEGAAAVVNLAGAGIADRRWTADRRRVLRASRIGPTALLTSAIRSAAQPPGVLVQGSGIGIYGDRGDERLTEQSTAGEGFLPLLARDWEAASEAVEEVGTRRVVVRTGLVLAREGGALARLLPVFRVGLGGRLGSGRQYFPWIHLTDEVAAIGHLIGETTARGPFHLVAPEAIRQREFARRLGRALRRPAVLPVPGWLLRTVLGELASELLTGQHAAPEALLASGFRFRFASLDAALADLVG